MGGGPRVPVGSGGGNVGNVGSVDSGGRLGADGGVLVTSGVGPGVSVGGAGDGVGGAGVGGGTRPTLSQSGSTPLGTCSPQGPPVPREGSRYPA